MAALKLSYSNAEAGSEIKGHMRSYADLLEASGYGSRRDDFDDLIRILDSDVRLITISTDPARGVEGAVAVLFPDGKEKR